jgi:predicted house-cleaning noncanonical NTP pyrophosphatase (MazG superfamily)
MKGKDIHLKTYNKLVRDRIPEIINKDGKNAVSHVLSEEDYIAQLDKKIIEEVNEYIEDKNLEEMADILEVLYAICKARGYTIEDLDNKRKEKAETRGGFQEKIFLEYVDEHITSKEN